MTIVVDLTVIEEDGLEPDYVFGWIETGDRD
jgi:hypothetical protein